MSRNGSGTYSLPVGNPVVTGTTISSTWANTTLTDISNALTGSLASDGQTTATGNLNMGTNKVVNAADPTNPQDVSTKYYTDEAIAAGLVTVTPAFVSDKLNTATGYFQVPQGTAAQRPVSPQNGIVRYNSDEDFYEGYIDGDWVRFQTFSQGNYTGAYVVVAGGGGGGAGVPNAFPGAGAGAGGYLASSFTFVPGTTYSYVIGGGGTGGVSQNNGTAGSQSAITGYVTTVGGGQGSDGSGGSGGGGGSGGSGTSGQGTNGGSGLQYGGGGGGGATVAGGNASVGGGITNGGNGGTGALTTITGSNVNLAGGGGGGAGYGGGGGGGGTGGGGAGGVDSNGGAGTVNTGGGGGGGNQGGNGGSGVIYISVPTANYTGTTTGSPTVTTSGANTVMKFTASGSYTA